MSHDQNTIAPALKASHFLAGRRKINKVGRKYLNKNLLGCELRSVNLIIDVVELKNVKLNLI